MSAIGFQSDSQILVETCLARLRVDAKLDEHPVLPAIEDLLPYGGDDEVIEVGTDEIIITADVIDIPSAKSIVREAARANAKERRDTPTERKRRADARSSQYRPARWPVLLCALVATYFGTTAFLRSPAAAKPEVQHVVKVSRASIAGAIDGAVKTTKSLVQR